MDRLILESGNKLNITLAPIGVSYRLFKEVVRAFKKNGIDIKVDRETELDWLSIVISNSGAFVSGFADVITSSEVMEAVFDCGQRCSYDNGIISKVSTIDIFEDCREDLFEVLKIIAMKNLRPFFPKRLMQSKATKENT